MYFSYYFYYIVLNPLFIFLLYYFVIKQRKHYEKKVNRDLKAALTELGGVTSLLLVCLIFIVGILFFNIEVLKYNVSATLIVLAFITLNILFCLGYYKFKREDILDNIIANPSRMNIASTKLDIRIAKIIGLISLLTTTMFISNNIILLILLLVM